MRALTSRTVNWQQVETGNPRRQFFGTKNASTVSKYLCALFLFSSINNRDK